MFEIIADNPDDVLRSSAQRLFELGWPRRARPIAKPNGRT
jgi:hypothetical protein